jgi:hypothetical protein
MPAWEKRAMKAVVNQSLTVKPRLATGRRPEQGVGEWLAAMVRGLDALEFLERSRELAAEAVVATPLRIPAPHK